MNFVNCLLDTVLTYEEEIIDIDTTQACLLAGIDPDELNEIASN